MDERSQPLLETAVSGDPMEQFERWFADASQVVRMPESVALATVGEDLKPSVRMVLTRLRDSRGFVFFTDYRSDKGKQIDHNPHAAMAFYWDAIGRQVRIEGDLTRVPVEESDSYFAARPRGSQIAAHASHQSAPIESRDQLEARFAELSKRFEGAEVPRPDWWGGFRLAPRMFEFWQERADRLHDRLRYSRDGDLWRIDRLQP